MKKHINQIRNNAINTEISNEGQSFSDFHSPVKSAEHADRFGSCLPYGAENKKTQKKLKIEEN